MIIIQNKTFTMKATEMEDNLDGKYLTDRTRPQNILHLYNQLNGTLHYNSIRSKQYLPI